MKNIYNFSDYITESYGSLNESADSVNVDGKTYEIWGIRTIDNISSQTYSLIIYDARTKSGWSVKELIEWSQEDGKVGILRTHVPGYQQEISRNVYRPGKLLKGDFDLLKFATKIVEILIGKTSYGANSILPLADELTNITKPQINKLAY